MEILLDNVTQNREEWLAKKRSRIGSSEICTLFGLNPFESPLQLWAKKTGKIEKETENDFMWLGTQMEPIIGKLFTKKTGIYIEPANRLVANSDYPLAIASPDFMIVDGVETLGIVETKNVNYRGAKYWSDEAPPRGAHMQLLWQLGVCDLKEGYVAGLVGGNPNEFYTPKVEFDQEIMDQMYGKAVEFMDFVEKDIPPQAGGSDIALLKDLFERTASTKEFDDATGKLLIEYAEVKEQLRQRKESLDIVEKMADNIKAEIIQALGENENGVYQNYRVTAKVSDVKEFTVAARKQLRFNFKVVEQA